MGEAMNGTSKVFRRATDPFVIPAIDTPSQISVASLPDGVTAFSAVNSYPVWIRLRGTQIGSTFKEAKEHEGWLFPPGHMGVYATQFPALMSAIAVARPGFPIKDANGALLYPDAAIEIAYGSGA